MSNTINNKLNNMVRPDYIETLEYYYNIIRDNNKSKTPITFIKSYEYYNKLIYNMNLPDNIADMLDEMIFNILLHNSKACEGSSKIIIINDVIFESFNEIYLLSLCSMFNNNIKICFDVDSIEEVFEGIQPRYNLNMYPISISLFDETITKPFYFVNRLYLSYETFYDYSDKNKLSGFISYDNDKQQYKYSFDEDD